MSCICQQPVRPQFKDSYKDLLDKPQINGVPLDGNLTPADLGIKAGAQFKIVPQLPVTDIDEATVYLVPAQVGQTDNIYQEWIYINNKWEKIGEPIIIDTGSWGIEMIPQSLTISRIGDATELYDIDQLQQATGYQFKDNTTYICAFTPYIDRALNVPAGTPIEGFYNYIAGNADSIQFSFSSQHDSMLAFDRMDIADGNVVFTSPSIVSI